MKNKFLAALIAPAIILSSLFLTAAPANAASLSEVQSQVLTETNNARTAQGLPALRVNPDLANVATNWSKQQYLNGGMSHNPNVGSEIPAGWYAWGENVAAGYDYRDVTTAWLNSPGHRANILNTNFSEIGIGYWEEGGRTYFTQVFANYKRTVYAPNAPTSLQLTGNTENSASVSWAAPSNNGGAAVTSYIIKSNRLDDNTTSTYQTSDTKYTIPNLIAGKTYTVTIQAVNSVGASPDSLPLQFTLTVKATAPSSPVNVKASKTDSQEITATWEAPSNNGGAAITSYEATLYDASNNAVTTVGTSQMTVTFPDVPENNSYYISVKAQNRAGVSAAAKSNTVSFATGEITPVTNITAQPTGTTINVTWKAPETTGGYPLKNYLVNVYVNGSKTAANQYVVDAGTTSRTFSTTYLKANTSYVFGVVAVTEKNSSTETFTPSVKLVTVTAPSTPGVQQVTNITTSSYTVNWTAPSNGGSDITGYTVTTRTNRGVVKTTNVTANQTSHTVTGLSRGVAYTTEVVAKNSAGSSKPAVFQTSTATEVPGSPTKVTVKASNPSTLVISWTAPSDNGGSTITGYGVQILKDNTVIQTVKATGTSATVSNLTASTTYTAKVAAVNKNGSSAAAVSSKVTTPKATVASAPQKVTASPDSTQTAVNVSWTAPATDGGSPVTKYVITATNTKTNAVTKTETANLNTKITGLTKATSYKISVQAVNSLGASTAGTVNVTLGSTLPSSPSNVSVALSGTTAKLSWSPSTDTGGGSVSYTVKVVDNGKVVKTTTVTTTAATIKSLTKNKSYTVQVTAGNSAGSSAPATATFTVK